MALPATNAKRNLVILDLNQKNAISGQFLQDVDVVKQIILNLFRVKPYELPFRDANAINMETFLFKSIGNTSNYPTKYSDVMNYITSAVAKYIRGVTIDTTKSFVAKTATGVIGVHLVFTMITSRLSYILEFGVTQSS